MGRLRRRVYDIVWFFNETFLVLSSKLIRTVFCVTDVRLVFVCIFVAATAGLLEWHFVEIENHPNNAWQPVNCRNMYFFCWEY